MYDLRRGERPPAPQSVEDVDRSLRDPAWLHLGRSLTADEAPAQLYQGMVGPPGMRSLLFVFLNVVQWLTATCHIFADGTFKVVRGMPGVEQLFVILTSWNDTVSYF